MSASEQLAPRGRAYDVLDYIDALTWFLRLDYSNWSGARRGWNLNPPVPVAWEWRP